MDTTILVYATGADHHLREPCRRLLELARDEAVRATTTVEVVQEYAHVRARRRPRNEAAQRAREYARGLSPLVRPEEDDLHMGLDLFEHNHEIGPFDSVLGAVTLRRRWLLASADRLFGQIAGLSWLNPAAGDFIETARAGG